MHRPDNTQAVHFGYAYISFVTSSAGCWTEKEATNLYHRKLMQLLSLYKGQMIRLRHVFRERRRAFLIQWQREGGSKLQGIGQANLITCFLSTKIWIP